MNPLAAYVYSKSSVLLDRYKPLGTILVSTITLHRYTALLAHFFARFLSRQFHCDTLRRLISRDYRRLHTLLHVHGIAHGLFALILDWSKAEASKLYYTAFVLVTFNPTRCNGDFLTRLISRASPRLQNFFAISDWLMDCLRSF